MRYLLTLLTCLTLAAQGRYQIIPAFPAAGAGALTLTRYSGAYLNFDDHMDVNSFQVDGAKKVLIVCVASSDIVPSTVVWDPGGANQALTLLHTFTDGSSFNNITVYAKIAPTSATSNVHVTWAAGVTAAVSVMLMNNANQVTPLDSFSDGESGTMDLTVAVAGAINCLSMGVVYTGDVGVNVDSPFLAFNLITGGDTTATSANAQTPYTGSGSVNMTWHNVSHNGVYAVGWLTHP